MGKLEGNSIKIGIINAELNLGQVIFFLIIGMRFQQIKLLNFFKSKAGTELGPNCLKTDFLFQNLENLGCEVVEYDALQDVPTIVDSPKYKNTKHFVNVGKVTEKLSKTVCDSIEQGLVPIILGGDHSLAIGSVHGSSSALSKKYGDPKIMGSGMGLIWVDAHADINTPLTSETGNLHGQPVSFILHELDEYLPGLQGFEWNLSW